MSSPTIQFHKRNIAALQDEQDKLHSKNEQVAAQIALLKRHASEIPDANSRVSALLEGTKARNELIRQLEIKIDKERQVIKQMTVGLLNAHERLKPQRQSYSDGPQMS